ncbi:MAG: YceH family protein [Rhodoferax sp.]
MTSDTPPSPIVLSPVQARVLGTLMEKARTVPDSYPLSLNALLLGCNQKTSRDPVMTLSEEDLIAAIDDLVERNLVRRNASGRVPRFEHNAQRGLGVPEQSAVLLGLLMLRGPQTAAELRLNAERWHRFADVSSVEAFLEELQDRSPEKGGPLVLKLPKAPGAREARWAHRLCGEPSAEALPASAIGAIGASGELAQRVDHLEAEVQRLRAVVARLCAELGVADDPEPHSTEAHTA